jgi:hypothetical protein
VSVLSVLGLVVAVLVALIAGGSAWLALRDSRHELSEARRRERERELNARRQAARTRLEETVRRTTPRRTGLKPYSPEIIAVLLLAIAAGLWLAKLAG